MLEFIVKEEDFSLKFVEKVPEPEEGECFLLYQEGVGEKKSMVVSRGVRYSSTAVRHAHYNKKVTFSLQKKSFTQDYRVVMTNVDFYFHVAVSISYEIRNVQEYFFGEGIEEGALTRITRKCVGGQNEKWQVKQGWELQRSLEEDIEKRLKQFDGVRFQVEVEAKPDDAAQKMQQSDKDTIVEIHNSGNRKNVQIAANKDREAIAESERALKMMQIQEIGMLMKNFGILGTVANEYIEGKIDGKEFYNYIMKVRTDDMNMLNMAVSNDLMTSEEAMDKINDILTNRRFEQIEQQLAGGDGVRIEVNREERGDMDNAVRGDREEDADGEEGNAAEEGNIVDEINAPAEGDFL